MFSARDVDEKNILFRLFQNFIRKVAAVFVCQVHRTDNDVCPSDAFFFPNIMNFIVVLNYIYTADIHSERSADFHDFIPDPSNANYEKIFTGTFSAR